MLRLVFILGFLALAGCSRLHYRERADREVDGIMAQKDIFPDWRIQNWHVYPDSRARFASCDDPDHPPYPPDDYPAWLLSPNPQRPTRRGGSGNTEGTEYLQCIEAWDAANRAADDTIMTVGGQTPLASEQKTYKITLEQSVELALFNSREFQDRREDLYIAALPVTNERFSFASQMFASEQVVREWSGRERNDAGSRWRITTDATLSRLFPGGGTLLARFANEIVLDMTSARPDISLAGLSLTLVQPFLAGAGYAVTLESLTQAERTLLYAIRSYARYRRTFYTAITVAGDYTNNPYGLSGLSVNLGRGVGVNLTAPSVGYLPTTLRASILNNERKNIEALERNLKLITNLKEGGSSTQLQVIQAEQQLITSRSDYLTSIRLYQDQLDNFKLQLGVPTTLPLELDDAPLKPMREQLHRFDELYAQMADFESQASQLRGIDGEDAVRQRWRTLLVESPLARGTPFAKEYEQASERLRLMPLDALTLKAKGLAEEQQKLLDAKAERQLKSLPDSSEDMAALTLIETAIDFVRFELAIRDYGAKPWLRVAPERRNVEQALTYRGVSDAGTLLGIRSRNQRSAQIRADWPDLQGVELEGGDVLDLTLDEACVRAARTALNLRLDLMNTRAQLVDSYRQIAIRANALQGIFDLRYDLVTGTLTGGGEGGRLGGNRTRNTITMRFEPPLVRRVERNLYRASLIAYQRQRRFLMAVEDNIVNDVRSEVRQLRALAEQYTLQSRAVELAYAQVDAARSTLIAPPDPAARENAGSIAALTDQLLRAQAQLLRSQNALYTVWVNYQTARTNLYLDLEMLPLDERGLWTHEPLPESDLPNGTVAPESSAP